MDQSVDIRAINERIKEESSFVDLLSLEMNKVIVGQKHLVECLMIGLLADGHILLEGVPGLAKTLAINTLANVVDAKFSRIRITSYNVCYTKFLRSKTFSRMFNDWPFS